MKYLVNAFSVKMLANILRYDWDTNVSFRLLTPEEFRAELLTYYVDAIGHLGTIEFLNKAFGLNLSVSRQSIAVNHGDELIVIMPWVDRLPPGVELTGDVMMQLYEQGLVRFIKVTIP
jgi:hypothetical protein